jgi:type IV secretion system protein VirB11
MSNEAEAAMNVVRWMLRPVQPILDHPGLTDFHINGVGAGRAFIDVGRGMERITLPYSLRDLEDLALYAAASTRQDISEATPIVSTRFPDGERVDVILPPAIEAGVVFSLRKPKATTASPDELERGGTFEKARCSDSYISPHEVELRRLYRENRVKELLELAIPAGLNIVFSGEVGTGKTHLARTYTALIPSDRRIVTIEDTRELLDLPQPNIVNLLYSKGEQSIARVKAQDLVECSMRLGMNWLINQELRDSSAYAYLDVLDSGHKVLTTVHAESARATRSRICGLIKKHPEGKFLDTDEIMASLVKGIDLIVHCKSEQDPQTGRTRRFIDGVLYDPDEKEKYASVPSPIQRKEAA